MKTMVFTPKSSGLALLSLGLLAARRATAVSNCAGLIDAIGVSATIVLESDFSCSSAINVGPGESVSVSGPHVITIDADFEAESTASSLFVNEGSLTLDGVTVESEKAGGVRAVHNEGELSLVGCTFTSLFGTVNSMLSMGGVVSGSARRQQQWQQQQQQQWQQQQRQQQWWSWFNKYCCVARRWQLVDCDRENRHRWACCLSSVRLV